MTLQAAEYDHELRNYVAPAIVWSVVRREEAQAIRARASLVRAIAVEMRTRRDVLPMRALPEAA